MSGWASHVHVYKVMVKLSVEVRVCNPSTWETRRAVLKRSLAHVSGQKQAWSTLMSPGHGGRIPVSRSPAQLCGLKYTV